MNPRLIVIDGKTYNSVNEMPDEVRQQYERAMSSLKDQDRNDVPDAFENATTVLGDNNKNGVPDVLENTTGAPIIARVIKVLADGQEFKSLDDLPPEARAKYEQAMGKLDANRNGIPDFMEAMSSGTAPVATPDADPFARSTTQHASRQPMPDAPSIEPDSPNGWLLALLAGLLLFLCGAAGVGIWYFFLR